MAEGERVCYWPEALEVLELDLPLSGMYRETKRLSRLEGEMIEDKYRSENRTSRLLASIFSTAKP